jgi:ferredoxin
VNTSTSEQSDIVSSSSSVRGSFTTSVFELGDDGIAQIVHTPATFNVSTAEDSDNCASLFSVPVGLALSNVESADTLVFYASLVIAANSDIYEDTDNGEATVVTEIQCNVVVTELDDTLISDIEVVTPIAYLLDALRKQVVKREQRFYLVEEQDRCFVNKKRLKTIDIEDEDRFRIIAYKNRKVKVG